jgi:hypothetical protein
MLAIVNKESWSGADSAPACTQNVLPNATGMRVQHHVAIEALHVETNLSGVHPKVFVRKSELVVIEKVVHLPKFVLGACRFCRLCNMMGASV